MATDSEKCVDKLLEELTKIDNLVTKLENDSCANSITEAQDILSSTQTFIDNNKSVIPLYCLKKVTDAFRRLEARINEPHKTKLQFKFKSNLDTISQLPKPSVVTPSDDNQIILPPLLGFQNKVRQKLSLKSVELDSKDVSLVNLNECHVELYGYANTVYIRDLKDTSVTVCLACRAITITNCTNCHFKLVCQQLRIDSTTISKFEIFTSARSMLESSSKLQFKCLKLENLENISQEEVKEIFSKAKFDELKNNWECIDDFDWLSPDTSSKNFDLIK